MMFRSEITANAAAEDRSDEFFPDAVAHFSDNDLMQCSREQLMQVVRASASVLPRVVFEYQLTTMSREHLEQLAFLARRGCQLRD